MQSVWYAHWCVLLLLQVYCRLWTCWCSRGKRSSSIVLTIQSSDTIFSVSTSLERKGSLVMSTSSERRIMESPSFWRTSIEATTEKKSVPGHKISWSFTCSLTPLPQNLWFLAPCCLIFHEEGLNHKDVQKFPCCSFNNFHFFFHCCAFPCCWWCTLQENVIHSSGTSVHWLLHYDLEE